MNRLGEETSPYLRQHAGNPVDWYPWGEEAFAAARERDAPVLLSVGYSACHWCHVMAHESFEDPAVAAVMNPLFVNVKVDREERPDVDAVYMEAVQAMTGHGGWPMTVFLTPDGRPFFGGTYFPPQPSGGMPGFVQLLEAVEDAWRNRREEVLAQADQLVKAVADRSTLPAGTAALSPETPGRPVDDPSQLRQALDAGYRALRAAHDDRWGGFGQAPKFPQPSMIELLLRAHAHNRSAETLATVATTLDAMASGGIYDHLGGGFARYSVDAHWLVPHFEKMLYDQAGLARVYLHAWQVTGEARWLQVVDETLGYVLRDLRQPDGGLLSAEDADSEGEEGRYYLWTREELQAVVGAQLAASALEWWGVTEEGNFEGRNILHRPVRGDLIRPAAVEEARRRLFEARSGRVRPGLDDKVLTEWNAMACAVLAEAGSAAGRADWVEAAVETAGFLLNSLRSDSARWMRSWQAGRSRHLAYASDYAWLVEAFVRVAEATGRQSWIAEACRTADDMVGLFWDDEEPGFFTTGSDAERLIVRTKEYFDGATPSANAVAVNALLRLEGLTGRSGYGERARRVLDRVLPFATSHPTSFTHALAGVDMASGGLTEVVVTGDRPDLVEVAQRRYLPNAVLAWGERGEGPLWEGRDEAAAYVCHHYACLAPARTPEELAAHLERR